MSDEESGDKPRKIGYRQPPVEHRFKKGKSGNPRGRPKKRHSALIPRELRRTILQVGDMPVSIMTSRGKKEVTAAYAVMMTLFKQAMGGKITSIRTFIQLYGKALEEHFQAHPQFEILEINERRATTNILDETEMGWINDQRKWTRKNVF